MARPCSARPEALEGRAPLVVRVPHHERFLRRGLRKHDVVGQVDVDRAGPAGEGQLDGATGRRGGVLGREREAALGDRRVEARLVEALTREAAVLVLGVAVGEDEGGRALEVEVSRAVQRGGGAGPDAGGDDAGARAHRAVDAGHDGGARLVARQDVADAALGGGLDQLDGAEAARHAEDVLDAGLGERRGDDVGVRWHGVSLC